MGGRQGRNDRKLYGQIFDHHFVEHEYADGSKLFSQCPQGQPDMAPPVVPDASGNYPIAIPGRTEPS